MFHHMATAALPKSDMLTSIFHTAIAIITGTARLPSIHRSHPNCVFLNDAQMQSEPLQIDFKSAWKLERTHARFNFGYSCLILDGLKCVCPMSEFPFEVSQSAMQSV